MASFTLQFLDFRLKGVVIGLHLRDASCFCGLGGVVNGALPLDLISACRSSICLHGGDGGCVGRSRPLIAAVIG
ncbi:hypothetical protein [Rhizobium sp. SG741]|uniref:hypothetical protein n=1 Tax=Rhizobium sp. SG741 TaxID=2587114 RepID=UPI001446578D|nr:hypothetical protein [Rhizobium sp. SG741]NKJ03152.1 hypothetical protein [Rhizobium sp. SG741]